MSNLWDLNEHGHWCTSCGQRIARADIGIHGGACPKYGEQELRYGIDEARALLNGGEQ